MEKKWIVLLGCGALLAAVTVTGTGFAKSDSGDVRDGTIRIENHVEADFPSMARIAADRAVQAALTSVQGQLLKVELEDENGFLVYGVEVVRPDKTIMEVKVDAGSGKVLAMKRDKADDEDRESGGKSGRDHED